MNSIYNCGTSFEFTRSYRILTSFRDYKAAQVILSHQADIKQKQMALVTKVPTERVILSTMYQAKYSGVGLLC